MRLFPVFALMLLAGGVNGQSAPPTGREALTQVLQSGSFSARLKALELLQALPPDERLQVLIPVLGVEDLAFRKKVVDAFVAGVRQLETELVGLHAALRRDPPDRQGFERLRERLDALPKVSSNLLFVPREELEDYVARGLHPYASVRQAFILQELQAAGFEDGHVGPDQTFGTTGFCGNGRMQTQLLRKIVSSCPDYAVSLLRDPKFKYKTRLLDLFEAPLHEGYWNALVHLTQDPSPEVRREVVTQAASLGDAVTKRRVLDRAIRDTHAAVREGVVEMASELAPDRAWELLRIMLGDKNERVRRYAASTIREMRDSRTSALALTLLRSASEEEKILGCRLLIPDEDVMHLQWLKSECVSTTGKVRAEALVAVGYASQELWIDFYRQFLGDTSPEVVREACYLAERALDAKAIPQLAKLLGSPDEKIAGAAKDALNAIRESSTGG